MYMAPEQAKGETLDHRADLFSLGSVLYVMCTGRPPFRATTTFAVLKRVAEDDPRPIREVIPEVPEWLCRIVEKLHAKDPAERFQSAREVADVLADCEAQLKVHSGLKDFSRIPEARPTPAPRPAYPHWAPEVFLVCAIFGLFFVGPLFESLVVPRFLGQWEWLWVGNLIFFALIAALIALTVRRIIRHTVEGPAGAPARRSGRRWKWAAAAVTLLLVLGGAWFGRSAMLYVANAGELEILPQEGLVRVIVLQDGDEEAARAAVTDWVDMKSSHTFPLPPGRYLVNASTSPAGTKVGEWEVTTSGPLGSNRLRMPTPSVVVTVKRGERVIVRATMRASDPDKITGIREPADDDGFVQLFNGKDLAGWKTHPDQPGGWAVRDGILFGRGSHLFSERGDYQNFHLRAEARINADANGGVWFRAPFGLPPPLLYDLARTNSFRDRLVSRGASP